MLNQSVSLTWFVSHIATKLSNHFSLGFEVRNAKMCMFKVTHFNDTLRPFSSNITYYANRENILLHGGF